MWSFFAKWDSKCLAGSSEWTQDDVKQCLTEVRQPLADLQRQADTHWLWRLTYEVSVAGNDAAAIRLLRSGISDRIVLTFNDPQWTRILSIIGVVWFRVTVNDKKQHPDCLFLLGLMRYFARATFFRSCRALQGWSSCPPGELMDVLREATAELRRRCPQLHLFMPSATEADTDVEPVHPAAAFPVSRPNEKNCSTADEAYEAEYGIVVADFILSGAAAPVVGSGSHSPVQEYGPEQSRVLSGWSSTLHPHVYESIIMTVVRYFKQHKLFRFLPHLLQSSAILVHRSAFVHMTAPFFHVSAENETRTIARYEYQVAALARDLMCNGVTFTPHVSTYISLFDHFYMSYMGCCTRPAFTNLAHCIWQTMRAATPSVDFVAPACLRAGFKPLSHESFRLCRHTTKPVARLRDLRPCAFALVGVEDSSKAQKTLSLPPGHDRLTPLLDKNAAAVQQVPLRLLQKERATSSSEPIKKKRIGYLSAFFHEIHSVFRDRQGIIRHRNPAEWDVTLFCVALPVQALNRDLFAAADRVVVLSSSVAESQAQLAAAELDVLVFCDIGMHPHTFFLAFGRYAPVQVNTWGHSDTSGIPTIDYFVSSRWFEVPDDAEAAGMYSERLVIMDGLSTYYQPLFDATHAHRLRSALGVPCNGPLVVCLQSLFKFGDEFLYTLIEIAEQNPGSYLVLLRDTSVAGVTGVAEEQAMFERRLDSALSKKGPKAHAALLRSQLVFLDRLSLVPYQSLVMYADIMLDPFPFGGCNSSFEAFQYGKPVVTLPSNRLNGRFTLGMYHRMGLVGAATESLFETEGDFPADQCRGIVTSASAYRDVVSYWLGNANGCSEDKLRGREDYERTCALIRDRRHSLFCETESVDEWYQLMDCLPPSGGCHGL